MTVAGNMHAISCMDLRAIGY